MKTKPYPQIEEKPMKVDEPAVAYQRTDPTSYRKAQMFDRPAVCQSNRLHSAVSCGVLASFCKHLYRHTALINGKIVP